MSQSFNCPNCGAPLDYQGSDPIIRCPYCSSSVIVPENLRAKPAFSQKPDNFTLSGFGDMGSLINQARRMKEVKDLAESGEMDKAVALYRQITGQDEYAARQAVGKLSSGQPITLTGFTAQDVAAQVRAVRQPQVQSSQADTRRLGCIIGLAVTIFVIGILAAVLIPVIGSFVGMAALVNQVQPAVATEISILPMELPTFEPESSPTPSFAAIDLQFGSEGTGAGKFKDARSVAVSPQTGNIFIAEYQGGRVQVFDSSGKFITQWLLEPPDKRDPIIFHLATDWSGKVYVLMSGKVYVFNEAGELQNTIAQDDYLEEMALALDGNLYVYGSDTLTVFSPQGELVAQIDNLVYDVTGDPAITSGMALDGVGNLYLLVTGSDSALFRFDSSGKYVNRFGSDGDEPGQFRAPHSLTVDGQGRIFVGDFKGIQVFENDGRYIGLVGDDIPGVAFGLTIDPDGRLMTIYNSNQAVRFIIKE